MSPQEFEEKHKKELAKKGKGKEPLDVLVDAECALNSACDATGMIDQAVSAARSVCTGASYTVLCHALTQSSLRDAVCRHPPAYLYLYVHVAKLTLTNCALVSVLARHYCTRHHITCTARLYSYSWYAYTPDTPHTDYILLYYTLCCRGAGPVLPGARWDVAGLLSSGAVSVSLARSGQGTALHRIESDGVLTTKSLCT